MARKRGVEKSIKPKLSIMRLSTALSLEDNRLRPKEKIPLGKCNLSESLNRVYV